MAMEAEATPTDLPRDSMGNMAATDTARGLLSLDMAMAVATPLSTRAALTTTDPMATTSTTPTARGLLSLAMDMGIMEELPAISTSPAPTLIMELESPTPTEKRARRTVRLRLYLLQDCYLLDFVKQNVSNKNF